jgi:hypothetical protein
MGIEILVFKLGYDTRAYIYLMYLIMFHCEQQLINNILLIN